MSDEDQTETVFFITRIGEPGSKVRRRTDDVQKHILGPVLERKSLRLIRADQDPTPGRISERIVRHIDDARVIIADVTGLSANVYYELGIAHSRVKPVVCLVDDAQTIPFDTIDQNHIVIGDDGKLGATEAEEARDLFEAALNAVLADDYQPNSPVTAANLTRQIAQIDDPESRALAELQKEMTTLRNTVDRLDRSERASQGPTGLLLTTAAAGGHARKLNLMGLTPSGFETMVTNLYGHMGFDLISTSRSNDSGVDSVGYYRDPVLDGKVILQSKQYSKKVGPAVVRELIGSLDIEKANKAILITTSEFTDAAKALKANYENIDLIDGHGLLHLLKEYSGIDARIEM